jgi:hypothetical protein
VKGGVRGAGVTGGDGGRKLSGEAGRPRGRLPRSWGSYPHDLRGRLPLPPKGWTAAMTKILCAC